MKSHLLDRFSRMLGFGSAAQAHADLGIDQEYSAPELLVTHEIEQEFFEVSGLSLKLTPGHKLSSYQASHKLYDRFLPFLACRLPKNSAVIDVGANVGDTYAAMISMNRSLRFVCVEPDPDFYAVMSKNVETINNSSIRPYSPPLLVNRFVGVGDVYGRLRKTNGSARVDLSQGEGQSSGRYLSISEIVGLYPDVFFAAPVTLIKSDVDGFDYAVIDSCRDHCLPQSAIWFFEAQTDDGEQLSAYMSSIKWLESECGYRFAVFDNFGGLLCHDTNATTVIDFLRYVHVQNTGSSTRTYIDVMAYQEGMGEFCRGVLGGYAKSIF
jgi:FkbM family methyltransferase